MPGFLVDGHRSLFNELLDKYREVFSDELGTMVGQKATIDITPEAKSRFHKARTVPYAYRDSVSVRRHPRAD